MKPNSRQLAMRDPALAALLGVFAAAPQGGSGANGPANFGSEFGDDYGADFEFAGDDMGYDFGAAPALPTGAAMRAMQQRQAAGGASVSQQRLRLIQPNRGSQVKVERYGFCVNQTLTLNTAVAIDMSGQPDTTIRPQRVTFNVPSPGMVTISELKVANVSVIVGGTDDAYNYNANGVGQSLDMPTLSPANRIRVLGNYTGFVPAGYAIAATYTLVASFKGPATIVA